MRSYSVLQVHEATQILVNVDYVREMTEKKSRKHGEYGLFEHLLFLFLMDCCTVLRIACSMLTVAVWKGLLALCRRDC